MIYDLIKEKSNLLIVDTEIFKKQNKDFSHD